MATVKGACPLCGPGYPDVPIAQGPDFEYGTTGPQEFRLARCADCGTVILDPRPADHEIAGLYPRTYEPYRFDELHPVVRRGRDFVQGGKVRAITRYARTGGVIVDVGCGNGSLLRRLQAARRNQFRLIGWDYPGPHLDRLAADGVQVIAAPIDAAHVPGDVDLFVLNQVIEHVPQPDRLLAMLTASLRPGGHLVIETPDTSGLDAQWFSKRYWGGYHIPRHMVLFNQRNLRLLVERAGLRVVHTARLASPAFWVQSLHHAALESRLSRAASLCTLRNVPLVMLFSGFDAARSRLSATSNQRLVAQKPTGAASLS